MPTCFVIQPFDGSKYDKRFEDVYAPAISAAGLDPYRVDKDPGVDVPIDAIEEGIRVAAVCLADITTDIPTFGMSLVMPSRLAAPWSWSVLTSAPVRSTPSTSSTEQSFLTKQTRRAISTPSSQRLRKESRHSSRAQMRCGLFKLLSRWH